MYYTFVWTRSTQRFSHARRTTRNAFSFSSKPPHTTPTPTARPGHHHPTFAFYDLCDRISYVVYYSSSSNTTHCSHKTLQVQFHDARSMLIQWLFACGLSLSHSVFRLSSTPFENIVMRERNVCSGSLLYRQLAQGTPGIPFSVQWYIGR